MIDYLIPDDELKEIMEFVRTKDVEVDLMHEPESEERLRKLLRFRKHTVELSFELRKRANSKYPDKLVADEEFDRYYESLFRELDQIQLEAMILSHEKGIHRRRPNTIRVIRDALMNKILMGE